MIKKADKRGSQSIFNRLNESFRSTQFYHSYADIKQLRHYNWLLVAFDILSVLTFLYVIPYVFIMAFNQTVLYYITVAFGPLTGIALQGLRLLYAALLLFSLVFFRYCITDIAISKLGTSLNFRKFWKLYFIMLLNSAVLYAALTFVMMIIQFSVRAVFIQYLRLIIVIPIAILAYLYYNALIAAYFNTQSIMPSIKQALRFTFKLRNFAVYISLLLALTLFSIIYLAGSAFMYFFFRDTTEFQYAVYLYIMIALFLVIMYVAVYFNRFYFPRLYQVKRN
ncbi:hypothetical protein HYV81_04515 [Candidatus Woesearchaeota archaeon]|nr:hypothetical protein [Candidatus Woesearchaeota archaeon]